MSVPGNIAESVWREAVLPAAKVDLGKALILNAPILLNGRTQALTHNALIVRVGKQFIRCADRVAFGLNARVQAQALVSDLIASRIEICEVGACLVALPDHVSTALQRVGQRPKV